MNQSSTIAQSSLICVVILAAAMPARAEHHEVVGPWDITVGQPPNTYPSWIKIEWKDGAHVAQFVGKGGGVHSVGRIKFENPNIEFRAHDRKWTGTLKGDQIEGISTDKQGQKRKWVARRFHRPVDLAGLWVLESEEDELFEYTATLRIGGKGRKLNARFIDLERDVEDLKLKGDVLGFTVAPGLGSGESARGIKVQVKGDRMEGRSTGIEGVDYRLKGKRRRRWEAPIELFNGKNLDGWKPLGDPNKFKWKVVDGVLTNKGAGGSANIVSEKKFKDFKLHVEFRVPKNGNSGVYLRGRYEVQVLDDHGKPPSAGGCGAIYSRLIPSRNVSGKPGEWQTFDIELVGYYVTVKHNGKTVIKNQLVEGITGGAIDSNEAAPGPIFLQGDHGKIEYRKITLIPAKPVEPEPKQE